MSGEQMSGEHMPPLGEQLSSVSLPSEQMSGEQMSVGEQMSGEQMSVGEKMSGEQMSSLKFRVSKCRVSICRVTLYVVNISLTSFSPMRYFAIEVFLGMALDSGLTNKSYHVV